MGFQVESRGGTAHIEGEMTIYSAAALHAEAMAAINRAKKKTAFDLSRVTEFDTAGLQIILAARKHAVARGCSFGIVAASPIVRDALSLCGLQELCTEGKRKGTDRG
jgi:anti-anti-sigma factor